MNISDRSSCGDEAVNEEILLGLLTAIAENGERSQRTLSSQLGVALGLANTYLSRCVKKGLVKVAQAPANRYAYYLTPKGFMEKGRLTREFLLQSFSLFRQARQQYGDLLRFCELRGWHRVVVWGAGDLGEITVLCASEPSEAKIVGFVDPSGRRTDLAGYRVEASLAALGPVDVVLLADLDDPQGSFRHLLSLLPAERVLAPKFLEIDPYPLHEAPE